MESLIALGTGLAMVKECYNTCFLLQHDEEYLLVDAGGGNGILRQLDNVGIGVDKISHMIVTHAHCDHVLGAIWVLRNMGILIHEEGHEGIFNIWCSAQLAQTIRTIANLTLKKTMTKLFDDKIIFNGVQTGTQVSICGWPITFFDTHSDTTEQYGFTMQLGSGEKLCFLGDEPFRDACAPFVKGSKWLLSEAFCLYAHREHFRPYEKNHATLKEACDLAEEYDIPNLVVWHSEDENYNKRKELFSEESKQFYSGKLHVPYDLEQIILSE